MIWHYFGVGDGTRQIIHLVEEDGLFVIGNDDRKKYMRFKYSPIIQYKIVLFSLMLIMVVFHLSPSVSFIYWQFVQKWQKF